MSSPVKLMSVLAHPDDESLGVGGILARYAAEGAETYVVCATRGERGRFGDAVDRPAPAMKLMSDRGNSAPWQRRLKLRPFVG